MLDHIGLKVVDVKGAKAFYDAALAPLGVEILMTVGEEITGGDPVYGYGSDGRPYFWVGSGEGSTKGLHVAFTAKDRPSVDAFYAAAMAAGGRDNGPPGIRAHYHPNYYGAFVIDADGHNVEAVCHAPAG